MDGHLRPIDRGRGGDAATDAADLRPSTPLVREDEFVDDWALSRLSPGIHLVA